MTRWKKELRKHGFTTEEDYPFLPIDVNGITLEGIAVYIEDGYIVRKYGTVVGCMVWHINRAFLVEKSDFI